MSHALDYLLAVGSPAATRFVRAAVELDVPQLAPLTAAGVPHYDASDFLRRLSSGDELDATGAWKPEVRAHYRAALAASAGADQPASASATPAAKAKGTVPVLPLANDPAQLGDAELVAVLLAGQAAPSKSARSQAERVLAVCEGMLGLADRDLAELHTELGALRAEPDAAQRLAAAIELARRMLRAARRTRPALRSPDDAAAVVAASMQSLRHEELWCLALDAKSRLIGEPRQVSRGDVDGADAGPRAFYRVALQAGAASAIAVHNHPSGDPQPSPEDIRTTIALVNAGRTIGCDLVDHLVIGDGGRFASIRRLRPDCFQRPARPGTTTPGVNDLT